MGHTSFNSTITASAQQERRLVVVAAGRTSLTDQFPRADQRMDGWVPNPLCPDADLSAPSSSIGLGPSVLDTESPHQASATPIHIPNVGSPL